MMKSPQDSMSKMFTEMKELFSIPSDAGEGLAEEGRSRRRGLDGEERHSHGDLQERWREVHGSQIVSTIKAPLPEIGLTDLLPRLKDQGYDSERVARRRAWIEEKTGASLPHIGSVSFDTEELRGNIENPIGAAQVPMGVAGPGAGARPARQGLVLRPDGDERRRADSQLRARHGRPDARGRRADRDSGGRKPDRADLLLPRRRLRRGILGVDTGPDRRTSARPRNPPRGTAS